MATQLKDCSKLFAVCISEALNNTVSRNQTDLIAHLQSKQAGEKN